ncbi:MAG: hypothetical protein [Olavius algarvensis Gamma 3 endosymbiont]|nr:MAG: hypothetical protein [Olavius algarvensis Gamma 3 endosymbiont]
MEIYAGSKRIRLAFYRLSQPSLHIARRRHKLRRNHINIKVLSQFFRKIAGYSLYLNEIRKNLAANLERSPLSHSYGYGSAGDRPTLFAIFPLSVVPFMQYAG